MDVADAVSIEQREVDAAHRVPVHVTANGIHHQVQDGKVLHFRKNHFSGRWRRLVVDIASQTNALNLQKSKEFS